MHTRQLCLALFSVCASVLAADNSQLDWALTRISSFADDICLEPPPLISTMEKVELSGEAKAKLSGVVKNLVDFGIEGAGKYQKEEHYGLLQEEIGKAMRDNSSCRLEVFRLLRERVLGDANPEVHDKPVEIDHPDHDISAGNNSVILNQTNVDGGVTIQNHSNNK